MTAMKPWVLVFMWKLLCSATLPKPSWNDVLPICPVPQCTVSGLVESILWWVRAVLTVCGRPKQYLCSLILTRHRTKAAHSIFTYGQISISNSPDLHVIWEETELPAGNPHRHKESMQTPNKSTLATTATRPVCAVKWKLIGLSSGPKLLHQNSTNFQALSS